ncbi:type I restriction-modification system subunit M [Sutterella wadsworthensis]|uniref:type I restriction-modification system subunit M n=5 Tax=Sutterella wadsworthensis TaxID=40545 RepID=UPI00242BDF04|nr:type I restriction-modification system subunit M [Sutterella wadsworthensis]
MSFTARDLNAALWAAADEMRQVMSADVYKDYLLGLVFYKALSDKILVEAYELLNDKKPQNLEVAQKIYEEAGADKETWRDLQAELEDRFGCAIEPTKTFSAFYQQINDRTFMLGNISQAFRDVEVAGGGGYEGLFDDFDIHSKDLGKTPDKRNSLISAVISKLAAIDFTLYPEDALGDAYEYLISQFASESGKKAGEFYTPHAVSTLIARIVTHGQDTKYGFTVYDPTCGSGSLPLQIRNFIKDDVKNGIDRTHAVQYFGQEIKNQTFNLARMNMMLHRVPGSLQHLRNGDTLDADWPTDEPTNFDAVVMNPPYSQKYDAVDGLLTDPRFAPYKKLPPASKADFAFLLHGFYHLKDTGTMGIVLPHGVLFRGGVEGTIREELLKKGNIYAVIGLPAGIFFSTGIPTCIVVLKKNNPDRSVFFIDGSKEFRKKRAKNFLDPEHIEKLYTTYVDRKDVEKYAHLATYDEIEKNDFNLNIPRYVDSSEEEEGIDLQATFDELAKLEEEEKEVDAKLAEFFRELGIDFGGEVK